MKNSRFRKSLSVFLSLLMMLTTLAVCFVPMRVEAEGVGLTLLGQFFNTGDRWNGVGWQSGGWPAIMSDGSTYLSGSMKISNENIFSSVTEDTGLTISYVYTPLQDTNYRHILSFGFNAANNTDKHLYISANPSHIGDGKVPVIGYVSGGEHINAYPQNGPAFQVGRTYDITVSISKTKIDYYIDGIHYDAACDSGSETYLTQFLREISGYKNNYVGLSRWGDPDLEAYIYDLRIYKGVADNAYETKVADAEYYFDNVLISDMLTKSAPYYATIHIQKDGASEDIGKDYYSNIVYADPGDTDFSGEVDKFYMKNKMVTPSAKVVLVYDGVNETSAPIEFETKVTNNHENVIHALKSNSSLMGLRSNWIGYMSGGYQTWAGQHLDRNDDGELRHVFSYQNNGDVGVNPSECQDKYGNNAQQDNTSTSRFWFNKLHYLGSGDTEMYYTRDQNISFQEYGSYTSWGSRHYENAQINTTSDYYIINYKPVYEIMNSGGNATVSGVTGTYQAIDIYNEILNNGWMYTDESVARAKVALMMVAKADPSGFAYTKTDFEGYAADCAATAALHGASFAGNASKTAAQAFGTINLVKKTAMVHISEGTGTAITVTNNGTPVTDGATVNYGDTLTVSAAALDAYDQHTPVVTISDEESAISTLVNRPEITISTDALALNTYTLTFDPNGGTLSGDASVTATYTQPLPPATQATRDGYTFQRYAYNSGSADYTYYDQNYTNNHGNYDVKGDVTVIAQWTPVEYDISFVPGAGSIDSAALANFGNTYTIENTKALPTATAPVGYHFDGWTVTASGDHGWGSEKIAANASVTGKWGSVTLTATYAPNTDTAYTVEYYEMGTDGAYPAAPTRTEPLTGTTGETATADTAAPVGFTFDDANVNKVISAPIAADGSTVLKVYFARNRYTVNVALGEGAALNVADGAKYYYGETVAFNVTAATGYDISTLSMTVDGAAAENGTQVTVAGDINVVVSDLEKLKYTVTVTEGAGTSITGAATGEYEYGTSITVTAAANEGYNAAGLKLMANGTVVTNPYTFTVTGDITISTADLNKLTFTVTKTEGAGTAITGDDTYAYGDSVTVSATALEGYTGDLVLKVNGEEVSNPYTFTITDNVAVSTDPRTAITYYTVVFNNFDNTKLYETSVPAGGTAEYQGAEPAKPAEGAHTFTFAGWNKPLTDINETTVLTAQFTTVHSYTVRDFDETGHFMKCAECGLIDESTREGHTLSTVTDRVATCSVEGMAHVECAGCDYATVSASTGLNENNHTAVSDAPAVPETCCTVGYTAGKVCSACGVYTEGHDQIEADPVNGHLYPDTWTPANGTHTKTCIREGCTDAVANHTISEECSGGTATCSAKAVCSVCGGAYGEVDAANHAYTRNTDAVTASCVTEGFTAGVYCDDCKQYISGHASQGFDYVNGHAYGSFIPNGDGTHSKRCTREGCTDAVANHTVTETCSGGTATCIAKAKCSVCGGEYGELNPANHEDLQPVTGNPSTCTEPGNNAYYYCSACDKSFTDAEGTVAATEEDIVIPATGHNWSVSFTWDDTVTPPTATAAFVCANNADHNVTVDASVTEIASSAARCGEEGSVTYRASYTMDGVTYATDDTTDKTVTTDFLPHLWSVQSWDWSDDHRTVTLNLICDRDSEHTHQIADIAAAEVPVSEATCTADKKVKYTASAEYEGYTFETASDEITLEGTALGHTYEFVGWTWADDHSTAAAKFVCAVENCGDTVFVSDDETKENLIAAPDCEKNKVVTYTASVEFKLTKNGDTQTFTDTTGEITLENTKTAHDWGEATYTWNEDGTVTAKRVCAKYASHVEEETVTPAYAVTADPTYTEKGEGTYTAAFTNAAFETKTRTEEIASIREQVEAALNGSGSGIDDIDALLEAAEKIVNGEAPYTAPYEEGYVDTLSDLLEEFEGSKNDPTKADTLADTLEEIKALVDSHEDHIVYTVTYVLNGGSAENRTSFVRADAAFTLNNPTKSGYVFAGWTGTGLSEATLTVTVNPADAENKEFTATWTLDHTDAEAAINNAAALIEDAADDYEDAYSEALAELVSQLEAAVAADEPDADAIRSLVDQVNARIADAANNKHSFTVPAGYKEGYEPTCTESGIGVKKCENCEKTQEVIVKALGHDWGEWIVDVPADYGVDGHAHRTCARCGATENKTLTLSAEYDRQIRFNVIPKMHYVIEVGDGYAVYNTNTILWYSAAELHFHVYTYTNSGYGDNYTVYINGKAATPDANGSYTLPAGSVSDTVSISVNNGTVTPSQPGTGHDGSSSGECAYCGKVHPNTLWGRIVALFHAIFTFFKRLFG